MKTLRQVKKGLKYCGLNDGCFGCPYESGVNGMCTDELILDALACIKQLEAGGKVERERFALRPWLADRIRMIADMVWQDVPAVEAEFALRDEGDDDENA